jgi:hypothetical protein
MIRKVMTFKKTLLFFAIFLFFAIPLEFFVFLVPLDRFKEFVKSTPDYADNFVRKNYPSDLVIKIKNGEVSVNRVTPYCLLLGENSKSGILFDENANPKSLWGGEVVTSSGVCNPIMVFGKDFLLYPDLRGNDMPASYRIQKISSTIDYELTQKELQKFGRVVLPEVLRILESIYYVVPFVLPFIFLFWYLIKNLWYAFVVKIVLRSRVNGSLMGFKEAYSKSLFALFIYTVFQMVFIQFVLRLRLTFPFLTTIAVVLITFLLEKYYYQKKAEVQSKSEISG